MDPRLGVKVGCISLFASIALLGPPANAESPAPTLTPALRGATAPRAKRVWRVQAGGLDPKPALLGDTVFLFEPSTRMPFAVDLRTGERRWTAQGEAKAPPGERAEEDSFLKSLNLPNFLKRSQRMPSMSRANLAVAGDKLLVSSEQELSAYAAKDGRLLWTRKDECHLQGTQGSTFMQRCYGEKAGLRVGESAHGRNLWSSPRDRWKWDEALAAGAVILWDREHQILESHALVKGGPAWRVKVSQAEQEEERGVRLGGPSRLLAHGNVIALLGAHTIAVDSTTGRELWRRARQKDSQTLFDDSGLWSIENGHFLRLEARTGKVLEDQPLPADVTKTQAYRLTAAGDRTLFVSSPGRIDPDAIMVTWTRRDPKPVLLRRPADTSEMMVAGSLLLAAAGFDGQLSALDPNSLEPALADLPAQAAVAALQDELGTVDRLRDSALAELPHLSKYFAAIAGQPRHELYDSALLYLARIPTPEALPALIDGLKKSTDDNERQLLFDALAKQDDRRATEVLVSAVKDEAGRKDKRPFWRSRPSDSLFEQLWRTGRSTDIGLCPPPGIRPLPATSNTEEIGTAHPIIFQGIAADGSWVHVCQAREDTTGDGKVEVHFGHHGDTFGDALRPYLIIGGGSGYAFDDILDTDPTGRYVAVREGPCLGLVDTKARTITALANGDLREADAVFGPARAVSFDGFGKLLYLKGGVPQNRLVMRILATGEEQVLDPGPGNLWRARLDSDGAWITIDIVDGPEWPATATTLAPRTCRGSPMSYAVYGRRGMDRVTKRVLSLPGGTPKAMPSLVIPFGKNLLIRDSSGALVEVDTKGAPVRTVVPASCQGRLLHADSGRGLVLVSCHDSTPATLQLFDRESKPLLSNTPLPDAPQQDQDIIEPGRPRFIQLAGGAWIDLEKRALVDRPTFDSSVVQEITDWMERNRGVYARRGDGAVLSGSPRNEQRNGPPSGPLRWNRPLAK